MRAALTVLLALALAGCFQDLLAGPPMSDRRFACQVLDQDVPLEIVVHVATAADPGPAAAGLYEALAAATGRDITTITRTFRPASAQEWTTEGLVAWADEQRVDEDGINLHVLWVDRMPIRSETGGHLAPGVIVVAQEAVERAAARLGKEVDAVAAGVLMHYAGHAMGLVNRGIPVQDEDIERRENPAGHDPVKGNVMHTDWHSAETVPDAPAEFSEDHRRDWASTEVCT